MQDEKEQIEKLNALCFLLIKICVDTDTKSMKLVQENVMFLDKELGDWEVVIKKK